MARGPCVPSIRSMVPERSASFHWRKRCQPAGARRRASHLRVMTFISGNRCHGRPSTTASNCALLSSSETDPGADAVADSHAKRPAFSRRAAHHAEAVVHDELDARGARVGEEVAVMGVRGTQCRDDSGQHPLGARAHVQRLRAQPYFVDADHFSAAAATSRSHAAQCAACEPDHCTVKRVAPRCSSMSAAPHARSASERSSLS